MEQQQQQQQEEKMFVRTMDSVDGYLELQGRLKEALSKGLFSLSQSKYSMGLIGQQQYDMDMKPAATVRVMEEADSDSMYCSFELHRKGSTCDSRAPRSSTSAASGSTHGVTPGVTDSGASGTPGPAPAPAPGPGSRLGPSPGSGVKDPLAWFGVMVPPPLKEAQRSFKEALELCIQLANHSQQIREGIDELQQEQGQAEQED